MPDDQGCENREKMKWVSKNRDVAKYVIYTEKTSIQVETHRRFCNYKRGQKPRYKANPKHSAKVRLGQDEPPRLYKALHLQREDECISVRGNFGEVP